MSVQTTEVPGSELLLRLTGDFEAADAWKVHETIQSAEHGSHVVLDFSQVRHFEDFAIALIAPDLVGGAEHRIRIRGLGMHQRRILEYFGVKGTALDERARWDDLVDDMVAARA
ncbi:MAG: anti-sigma factor antagonist [Deltaproteobacteria bacterium]|nr:anti-sigma factor antagonist [Deltaproteobacteria bacterium]